MTGCPDSNSGRIPPAKSAPADPTASIIIKILRAKPAIRIKSVSSEGVVQVVLPLTGLGIHASELGEARLLRTSCVTNFLGCWLLRQHIRMFDDIVCQKQYPDFFREIQPGSFWINSTHFRFQFHVAFLHRLFNEDVHRMLKTFASGKEWM